MVIDCCEESEICLVSCYDSLRFANRLRLDRSLIEVHVEAVDSKQNDIRQAP
jgi:hypothetical protein